MLSGTRGKKKRQGGKGDRDEALSGAERERESEKLRWMAGTRKRNEGKREGKKMEVDVTGIRR